MLKYRLIAIAGVVAVAALAVAGCGSVANAALSPETDALAAIGVTAPDPSPSVSAKPKPLRARALLRRNTVHGEVVVKTKDGPQTVLVQRGAVTAINDTTMTVKSTDGFTQTWTFGQSLRVVERRTTVQPKDVAIGVQVGVAGAKNGDQNTARLIVITD